MPPSIRQQTRRTASKIDKRATQSENRKRALSLLQNTNMSIRKITSETGIPKSTVAILKQYNEQNDNFGLQKLLNASTHAGRPTVLSHEEERMIVERLNFAASRGSSIDISSLKYMMARIAADGRKSWKNGIPSDEAVRSFRAWHRDIT